MADLCRDFFSARVGMARSCLHLAWFDRAANLLGRGGRLGRWHDNVGRRLGLHNGLLLHDR